MLVVIVHAGSTFVRSDLAVSRVQVALFVDFIDQAMPFTSSNTVVFQCGQHRIGPDAWFRPGPVGEVFSGESRCRPIARRHY